jgi:DNA-binding NarL/FixJ family response regulator
MTIRVLVVDDHPLVASGIRKVLSRTDDIRVVGEARDVAGAVAEARRLRPDVVLMDVVIPGGGIEATRRIRRSLRRCRVLGITGYGDAAFADEMRTAGGAGMLSKTCTGRELAEAIRAVAAGGWAFVDGPGVERGDIGEHPVALTPRERQVLALISAGAATREIAKELGVVAKTVEVHRRNLRHKLGIFSVAGLTQYALRAGLVPPRP